MTNKLPKVGRRYKSIDKENSFFTVDWVGKIKVIGTWDEEKNFDVSFEDFWNNFEEIPEETNSKHETCKQCGYEYSSDPKIYAEERHICQSNSINLTAEGSPQEKLDRSLDCEVESEKPKSIWKDVSELPKKDFYFLSRCHRGEIIPVKSYITSGDSRQELFQITGGDISREYIKEFCTLTDFIKSFEELQERVSKLEERCLN